jgi:2-polyprenyl-3-methyl-5-hydroxy-6-metoxy-1,4-benzoquinol methylase
VPDPLASGDYARKQIYCPNPVVAWSHGSRFRLAAHLAARKEGGALLDYGCGDGTFIALTHGTFARVVGADTDEAQLDDCRRRFSALDDVLFLETSALTAAPHRAAYDAVTCMEVLEHCTDAERRRVIDELGHLCAPQGLIIISVPIEIGPALAAKQLFRVLAAWRGQGDYQYRETYSPKEWLRAVLARPRLARAEYLVGPPGEEHRYCGHKGFDWRVLEGELRQRLRVEQRLFSPMGALGPLLNSQVWFVCRPRV